MNLRSRAAGAFLVLAVLAPGSAISRADVTSTTVAIANAEEAGGSLHVSGTAAFADQPFVTVGSDPALDGPTGVFADLVGAAASAGNDGTITFRWDLNSDTLLPIHGSAAETWLQGTWFFCAPGVGGEACFRLVYADFGSGDPGDPWIILDGCSEAGCENMYFERSGRYDPESGQLFATVPADLITTEPDAALTPWDHFWSTYYGGYAFSQWCVVAVVTFECGRSDGTFEVDDYVLPRAEVSFAIASPGLDPATLDYSNAVEPSNDGTFAATLDVSAAPDPYAVYVRACLGTNNCAFDTRTMA